MIEDLLTHDERLRLECIAQANIAMGPGASAPSSVIGVATQFEEHITRDSYPVEAEVFTNPGTLDRVYAAIESAVSIRDAYSEARLVSNIISSLQNAGILFRERKSE